MVDLVTLLGGRDKQQDKQLKELGQQIDSLVKNQAILVTNNNYFLQTIKKLEQQNKEAQDSIRALTRLAEKVKEGFVELNGPVENEGGL